uniref:Uncharacterized protein n=1 Tax=Timema cristinae TaxID=61476 RepID=A0A7R9CHR4_TIMCR|nr:unnamed protein product [Timema cristinae]
MLRSSADFPRVANAAQALKLGERSALGDHVMFPTPRIIFLLALSAGINEAVLLMVHNLLMSDVAEAMLLVVHNRLIGRMPQRMMQGSSGNSSMGLPANNWANVPEFVPIFQDEASCKESRTTLAIAELLATSSTLEAIKCGELGPVKSSLPTTIFVMYLPQRNIGMVTIPNGYNSTHPFSLCVEFLVPYLWDRAHCGLPIPPSPSCHEWLAAHSLIVPGTSGCVAFPLTLVSNNVHAGLLLVLGLFESNDLLCHTPSLGLLEMLERNVGVRGSGGCSRDRRRGAHGWSIVWLSLSSLGSSVGGPCQRGGCIPSRRKGRSGWRVRGQSPGNTESRWEAKELSRQRESRWEAKELSRHRESRWEAKEQSRQRESRWKAGEQSRQLTVVHQGGSPLKTAPEITVLYTLHRCLALSNGEKRGFPLVREKRVLALGIEVESSRTAQRTWTVGRSRQMGGWLARPVQGRNEDIHILEDLCGRRVGNHLGKPDQDLNLDLNISRLVLHKSKASDHSATKAALGYNPRKPLCPYLPPCQHHSDDSEYLHGIICELCGIPCLHPYNKDLQKKHTNCKLAFCKTIADECQPFLQRFQTSKPMTPYLFEAVEKLLRYLMNRCVKPDLMKCTGPKLLSIDTKKSENLILSKNIDIGFATKRLLGETAITVTERQKLEFIHECRSMLTTMIAKLQEKSPLKQKAVRGLSSLDPCVIQHSPQLAQKRFSFLLEELNHANIINDVLAENAKKEYLHFCNLKKSELQEIFRPCDQFSDEVGLDTIYGSFLIGEANYKHLWEVIKICLVLSHGNATVEGGFSVNKSLLVENMHEKTVIAQRHIHDEIQEAGGIKNIHISKKMLDYVRGARKRYHEYLEMKKQEKSEKDKKKAEKRKLDIQVKDLEGERKKLMMATEEKREAIDVELQELKKKQASLY